MHYVCLQVSTHTCTVCLMWTVFQLCAEMSSFQVSERRQGPHFTLVGGQLTMSGQCQVSPQLSDRSAMAADTEQLASAAHFEAQLIQLQQENGLLQDKVARQETDLNRLKVQLGSVREDRDRLKRRVSSPFFQPVQ